MDLNSPSAPAVEEGLKQKWFNLLTFLGFSILELWVLFFGNLTFERWKDWIIVGGAFFFPLMALRSASSLANDSRLTDPSKNLALAIKWLLAAPFVLIGLVIAGWALYSIFGWFATIPSWAAVIILILLFKK